MNSEVQQEQARFMNRVFGWMTIGLIVTAAVAYILSQNTSYTTFIIDNSWAFWVIAAVQLIEVIAFTALLKRLSPGGALLLFLSYAATVGLTFSVLFLLYTSASIGYVFLITSVMFAALALFGYVTRINLGRFGTFLFMALIGLVVAQVANIFIHSSGFSLILAWAGVLIFAGLTAADVQKIKKLNVIGDEGSDEDSKQAISGALELYLDFINLFLNLLRIFGGRR